MQHQMDDSYNTNVTTINAEPFIYAPMNLLQNIISEFIAVGRNMSGVAQVIDVVVTELEWQALTARLTDRTHVFQGKLTVAEALQRARELQQLALS